VCVDTLEWKKKKKHRKIRIIIIIIKEQFRQTAGRILARPRTCGTQKHTLLLLQRGLYQYSINKAPFLSLSLYVRVLTSTYYCWRKQNKFEWMDTFLILLNIFTRDCFWRLFFSFCYELIKNKKKKFS
jgi:hypothetical protein